MHVSLSSLHMESLPSQPISTKFGLALKKHLLRPGIMLSGASRNGPSVPFHLPCSVPEHSGSLASSAVPGFYRCQYPRLAAHAGCQSLTHAAGCPMLSSPVACTSARAATLLARARAHLATPQGQPNVPGTRRKNCKARIRGRGRWHLAPLATIRQLASTGHWLPSLRWPIVFP